MQYPFPDTSFGGHYKVATSFPQSEALSQKDELMGRGHRGREMGSAHGKYRFSQKTGH